MSDQKPEQTTTLYTMAKDEAGIFAEARTRFSNIIDMCWQERALCREDRQFYSVQGAQWAGQWGEQFENKAKIEVNKTHLAIIKIMSAHRQNPITCDFISREGKNSEKLAEVCDGFYRSDEQDSSAQEAYDTGFEEAVSGGFGAFRLTTEYENEYDEEDDRQRIKFEPITDADQTVFFDPNAKRMDKSDAMYAFVLTPYTKEAYEAEWGDYVSNWDNQMRQWNEFDWVTDNSVYVAEYFRVEESFKSISTYVNMVDADDVKKIPDDEITEEMEIELSATGYSFVKTRKVKSRCVKKYFLSGSQLLEPGQRIAGTEIPIVPCYGKRIVVDNIERLIGHVRLVKDAQRLKNMQTSRLAEIASKSTVEKPILFAEQVTGHTDQWEDDLVEDYPYLLINMIEGPDGNPIPAGAAGSVKPPMIPPALAALFQSTDMDMKEILGNQEGGEEIRSNVGKDVVEQIHARLDLQNFIYMSNMAKSVQRSGQIWLSMAKDVYVEEGRFMKTVDREGNTQTVEIGRLEIDDETKKPITNTKISEASFNVYANVAPASASRKSSTVRSLVNMMKVTKDQESVTVMGLMALMNTEGEGVSELQDYARMRLVKMGVLKPTDEEAKKMAEENQNKGPSAEEQFLQAEAQKAMAQAEEAKARTQKSMVEVKKTEAQTISILAQMDREDREQVLNIAKEMSNASNMAPSQPQ